MPFDGLADVLRAEIQEALDESMGNDNPDIDGDGVANDWDCHNRNLCLGGDLDRDGICEGFTGAPACQPDASETFTDRCVDQCIFTGTMHGLDLNYFDLYVCSDQCREDLDNCAPQPGSDAACDDVRQTCADPDRPTDDCDLAHAALCDARHANPLQEDTFGVEGIGDQCESGIAVDLVPSYGGGTIQAGNASICQIYGEQYRVQLNLYGGDMTLDAGEAALQPEEDRVLPLPVRDMTLWEDAVVVATPAGVGLLDGATRQWLGTLTGRGVAGARGLSTCGGFLCLSRLGMRGLVVLDLSDPAHPAVRSRAFTAGLGWDVAAHGRRVYIAHGILGVGVYRLSGRGALTYQGSVIPGGLVRSVAASRDLVAAARRGGTIHLYRRAGGLSPAGQVQATGKVSRVRLVDSQLWVLSKKRDRLEIFDVTNPAAPTRLAALTAGAAEVFRRRLGGPYAFTFSGHLLRVQRVARVTP
jgi:hypothetical protein